MNNNEYFFNKYAIEDLNNFGILQNNMMSNINLYQPKEGFEKGNLFPSLYEQYKNYSPANLIARTEQERMFFELSSLCFVAHELNLYLDIYPNNLQMIQLFNDYRKQADELKRDYENKYGVINITSLALEQSPFAWVEQPWPWEGMVG